MKYESPQTPICSGTGSIIDTSKIFRVGDIVKTVPHPLFGAKSYTGKIDTIVDIDDRVDVMYPYKLKKLNMWIHPNELEHYIEEKEEVMKEKEFGKEDNFSTKELNLLTLLNGCEKEKFYSLIAGDVIFKGIDSHWEQEVYKPIICTGGNYNSDGTYTDPSDNGVCCLFPSRALYEKYPLDAYSAWMEWKSERTPKRWRAEYYKPYWYLDRRFIAKECTADANSDFDRTNYENGNMFRTEEEAKQAAEVIIKCLMKFHENYAKQ